MSRKNGVGLILAAAIFSVGCGESSGTGIPTGSEVGQVTVQLTDAPFPFSEVQSVDVFVVRVDGRPSAADSAEAANESSTSGWQTLASPNQSINLLDLANGQVLTLGTASVPAGTYRGFRMIIDVNKSSVTLVNGSKPNIKWPSAGKTGLKVLLDEPVSITGVTTLVLDFDVGRSFVMRGNSISQNGLLFKPVIHASVVSSSGGPITGTGTATGSISGSVRGDSPTGAGIHDAAVEVLKNGTSLADSNPDNVVRSGHTDANGNFTLTGIPPGVYVVRASPHATTGYKPALLTGGVTVVAGSAVTGLVIVVNK